MSVIKNEFYDDNDANDDEKTFIFLVKDFRLPVNEKIQTVSAHHLRHCRHGLLKIYYLPNRFFFQLKAV